VRTARDFALRCRDSTLPMFRCTLTTGLTLEKVMERVRDSTSCDSEWIPNWNLPFRGTVQTDRFRVSHRKQDPGIDLVGKAEIIHGGTTVSIKARESVISILVTVLIGSGFTFFAWIALQEVSSVAAPVSLVVVPPSFLLLHIQQLQSFWKEVDTTLTMLSETIDATVTYRSHDQMGRRIAP